MIKDLFQALGLVLKYSFIAIAFVFKCVGWYVQTTIDMLRRYPKEGTKKVSIKGEII